MTDDELTALEKLCDAATPGPWTIDDAPRLQGSINAGIHQVAAAMGQAAMHDRRGDTAEVQRANAAFIAIARDTLPALLAELRRLRAAMSLAEARCEGAGLAAMSLSRERDIARAEVEKLRGLLVEAWPYVSDVYYDGAKDLHDRIYVALPQRDAALSGGKEG